MLFNFKARNSKGEKITGQREAPSINELTRMLLMEDIFLISAESYADDKKNKSSTDSDFLQRIRKFIDNYRGVPMSEKMFFARYLALMVSAGISISDGLGILAEQSQSKFFKRVLLNLQSEIQKGGSLSKGLEKYSDIFSELFVNMVKMGETSGNLDSILNSLAEQLKKDNDLKSKIKGSMVYPSVIVLAMVGIGIFMMIYVVPSLTAVFTDLKVDLPASTKLVIFVSKTLKESLVAFIIGILTLIGFGFFFFKSKSRRHIFDSIIIRLPIIGGIAKKVNLARFSRTLGILVSSNLPVVDALTITSNTLTNKNYSKALLESAESVKKGQKLNEVMRSYLKIFPLVIVQMIKVGEETGALDEVLKKMADYYEEEVDVISKSISSIIEPVLMIVIGIVVGFFAVSMVQPLYSMTSSF